MERGKTILELSCAAVACLLMGLLLNHHAPEGAGEGEAAHAPFKTPLRNVDNRPLLDGRYRFVYCGGKGEAVIRSEGDWESFYAGSRWLGHWKVEGDVLTVGEAIEPAQRNALHHAPVLYTWHVSLEKGQWKGKLASGGDFEILLPAIREK